MKEEEEEEADGVEQDEAYYENEDVHCEDDDFNVSRKLFLCFL